MFYRIEYQHILSYSWCRYDLPPVKSFWLFKFYFGHCVRLSMVLLQLKETIHKEIGISSHFDFSSQYDLSRWNWSKSPFLHSFIHFTHQQGEVSFASIESSKWFCLCSSSMTKDHLLEKRYGAKWPLCANVPLSPYSLHHTSTKEKVCFFNFIWRGRRYAVHRYIIYAPTVNSPLRTIAVKVTLHTTITFCNLYTGELGYDGLNGTRKIGPSYAKSVVYIWHILDMHRTGTKHIVHHMQKSLVQWSVLSKFTCIPRS